MAASFPFGIFLYNFKLCAQQRPLSHGTDERSFHIIDCNRQDTLFSLVAQYCSFPEMLSISGRFCGSLRNNRHRFFRMGPWLKRSFRYYRASGLFTSKTKRTLLCHRLSVGRKAPAGPFPSLQCTKPKKCTRKGCRFFSAFLPLHLYCITFFARCLPLLRKICAKNYPWL